MKKLGSSSEVKTTLHLLAVQQAGTGDHECHIQAVAGDDLRQHSDWPTRLRGKRLNAKLQRLETEVARMQARHIEAC